MFYWFTMIIEQMVCMEWVYFSCDHNRYIFIPCFIIASKLDLSEYIFYMYLIYVSHMCIWYMYLLYAPLLYFFSHLYLKESFIVQDCISTDKWIYMHSISSSNVFGERNPLSNWPVYLQREERTCGNVAWVRMVIDMVLHLKKIQNMFLYDKGWMDPKHLTYFALKWSILWYHINFSSNISILRITNSH